MNADIATIQQERDNRRWWALGAVCFGLFMALLDVTVVNVALPTIQHDLNESFSTLEWVVNAYTLVFAVVLVTSSRLGDIYGRKRVFMIGMAVFTLGSFLCAISSDFHIGSLTNADMLNISRGIQGLGGSAMMPLSLALISTTFHGRERGTAFGIWGGVSGLATAIGPLVGGALVEKVNWQSIFYINIPIGIIGIGMAAWAILESKDERASKRIDMFGLVTITAAMFCLILALIKGNEKGWTSTFIITLFVIAAVSFIAFIIGELRLHQPMVDPRLFRIPSFAGASIAALTLSAGLYALFFYLSLYMQNLLGFDPLQAGLRFLPLSLLVFVGAPIAGRMTDKVGPKWILVVGMGFVCGGVFLMSRLGGASEPAEWIVLLPGLIVAGIGNGMVNPPISSIALGTVDHTRAGMASGANNVCRQIGMAFGIAFLGALLSHRYNVLIAHKVAAIHSPYLTEPIRNGIVSGLQQAGPIAASLGLKGDGVHANPYAHLPLFPTLQSAAQSAFLGASADIVLVAGSLLAVGLIASLLLITRRDMRY